MTRTPEQSAAVAAWLNVLDHCEAQLQSLGAFPKSRVTLRESRETNAKLDRVVARLAEANHRIADLATAKASLAERDEERRLELVVLAQELGCDCVPRKMLEAVKALQDAALKVKR